MKLSKNLFLLSVLIVLSSGSLSAYADDGCTIFGSGATCVCATMSPDWFAAATVTGPVFDREVYVNQTFNLVVGGSPDYQYFLSGSDVDTVESACTQYLATINNQNSDFVYSCGTVKFGPIQRGCYQDLGADQNYGFYGCATIPYASEDILRTPQLDQAGIQKAQCEKIFEASIYLTNQDRTGLCPSDFFHPHKWYNDQKKTLDLISQHLGCN
jgi:hypothetical protein